MGCHRAFSVSIVGLAPALVFKVLCCCCCSRDFSQVDCGRWCCAKCAFSTPSHRALVSLGGAVFSCRPVPSPPCSSLLASSFFYGAATKAMHATCAHRLGSWSETFSVHGVCAQEWVCSRVQNAATCGRGCGSR